MLHHIGDTHKSQNVELFICDVDNRNAIAAVAKISRQSRTLQRCLVGFHVLEINYLRRDLASTELNIGQHIAKLDRDWRTAKEEANLM